MHQPYNADEVLEAFSNDECPPVIFGPDRPEAAKQIARILATVTDDPAELGLLAAFGAASPQQEAQLSLYCRGVAFLRRAYPEYGWVHRFAA